MCEKIKIMQCDGPGAHFIAKNIPVKNLCAV